MERQWGEAGGRLWKAAAKEVVGGDEGQLFNSKAFSAKWIPGGSGPHVPLYSLFPQGTF